MRNAIFRNSQRISDTAVKYEFTVLHNKLATKCNLFTNESLGFVSYGKIAYEYKSDNDLQSIVNFYSEIGAEEEFREMLVIDALCFNEDRHFGNFGVLFNNETLQIVGIAPIFDLNNTLFPYTDMDSPDVIMYKINQSVPKLGDDFTSIGQIAMTDKIRDKVRNIVDFEFTSFRGDDVFSVERLLSLEDIIRKQAKALLNPQRLYTKEVFFSQKFVDGLCECCG